MLWKPGTLVNDANIPHEKTLSNLVEEYPEKKLLRYAVGRACAAGGYTTLYHELELLPDVAIAEEARQRYLWRGHLPGDLWKGLWTVHDWYPVAHYCPGIKCSRNLWILEITVQLLGEAIMVPDSSYHAHACYSPHNNRHSFASDGCSAMSEVIH
ncbi:hypothetical protein FE257_001487 [Aspergillus nanangensis]|uniref:Uncharacterized protein n=1 Tax=Aspergillus nanangensis TaxID=2582783 RepID=A0AAD4CDZ5_ASPNN|nr:hypothetical protein FE257_001487 [Aspergillus nanangensis]